MRRPPQGENVLKGRAAIFQNPDPGRAEKSGVTERDPDLPEC